MRFATYAIDHKAVIYLTIFLLLAGGLAAYQKLGKLEDPTYIVKTAVVVTPYPGAGPYEVEQQVTDVIEKAAQSADEVENIYSISRAGVSVVYVDIMDHNRAKQIQQLWDMLRRKIADAQGGLPQGAGPSRVEDDFGDVYGIFLALTGDGFSNAELENYAEFIQRELLLVENVSRVQIFGTRTQAVNVDVSMAKCATLGIHPHRIVSVLRSQNRVVVPGSVQTGNQRIRVDYPGDFESMEEIGDLVINSRGHSKITLADIATISHGYADPPEPTMRFNGKPSVGIGISASSKANVVTMGDAVQARLDALFQHLPVGLQLDGVYYQSKLVKGAIRKFVTNLLESVGIVIGVLLVTMGLRSGLLIASGLVLSICGTLIVMLVWGIDLQRISLAALILVMGMIVDNAIVVTDGSLVRLKRGQDRTHAAVRSAERTAWPLLGATVIAILAFMPIFLAPTESGEYCRSLFQVVSVSLVLSWLLAMSQTPVFCDRFLKRPKAIASGDPFASLPFRVYTGTLKWCLRHRFFCGAIIIGLCAFGVVGMGKVEKRFFAESSKAQFFIDYWQPEGTRIETTSAGLRRAEEYLATLPEIKNFATIIGTGTPRVAVTITPEADNPAFGQIVINVHDYRTIPALQEKLDAWFIENQPDADPKMRSYKNGPPADYMVEARFSGPDPAVLRRLAESAKKILRDDPYAKYVRDDWRQRVPRWVAVYSQQRGRDAGVERNDLARAILQATDGLPVAVYREGNDLIPLRVRSVIDGGPGIPSPESTPVWGTGAASIPLGQVADVSGLSWEDSIVRRYDRRRAITVQSDTVAGITYDALLARVRPKIEAISLPQGYTLDWAGEYELAVKGDKGVQKYMPLALMMMFFILVALFNGFRQPVIIMLVVPLALVGMVTGLLLTGQAFGFMAMLGAYSLIGMLIKNAVVLIEQIEFSIKEGVDRHQAVIDASVSRLRPVTMASATTILGMLPLLTDPLFASMAVTIMFGLAFASVLTLIVVPMLYTLFFRVKPL